MKACKVYNKPDYYLETLLDQTNFFKKVSTFLFSEGLSFVINGWDALNQNPPSF